MPPTNTLLKITVISDDDTGVYDIGDLDFEKPEYCDRYLEKEQNRKKFVKWLRWLADAAENRKAPFSEPLSLEETLKRLGVKG